MKTLEIISVNISEKKGIIKSPVPKIVVDEKGIVGDAHAGDWHRQVSLLAQESIERAEEKAGRKFPPGTFAENLTTRGVDVHKTAVFDRFVNNEVDLEVTQIGKKCHSTCEIGKAIGNCIMPLEGIFCKVIKGGKIEPGSTFEYRPRVIKVKVITLSERAFSGVYADRSGPHIKKLLTAHFEKTNRHFSIENVLLPDNAGQLRHQISEAVETDFDIVITTGGTGIGRGDITPETVQPLLEKEITGIMELVRVKYGMTNPNAVVSRSIAGTIKNTLVYCLPGSVKAVNEYMAEILPTLEHSFRMLAGMDAH